MNHNEHMTPSNRDEILQQAEAMGLALSADGTSWVPITESSSVNPEATTAKEDAATKAEPAPAFLVGMVQVVMLYIAVHVAGHSLRNDEERQKSKF